MYNIQIADIGEKIKFSEIGEGEAFLKMPIRLDTSLDVYLKTESLISTNGIINTVNLNLGDICETGKDEYVYPIYLE